MPLEAVMLCMDNSEYSRNADYLPTRFSAERDCINLLTSAKLNGNPESTVGLLTLAGPRIELHVSPTRDVGRIMNACAKSIEIGGESRFVSGLRTAALALKNRANKNQRQRIILFCGSPVAEDSKELVKLGKAFKKNNIAVDVINFGDEETQAGNAEKWEAFIEAVTTSENSHLVIVPAGPHQLSDMIMSSPIIVEPGQAPPAAGAAGAAAGGDGFGFDADADPEMAMAIRMSMEEERLRQERLSGVTATPAAAEAGTATGTAAASTPAAVGQPTAADLQAMEDDEEALLQQAIAMSMQADEPEAPAAQPAQPAQPTQPAQPAQPAASNNDDFDAAMEDPDFINDLLASVTQTQPDANTQNQNKPAEGDKKPEDKQ